MNWQTPQELPDLRRVGIVALDTETRDAGLQANRGSSWPWRDGHVCGISVARREGGDIRALYIPLCHPDTDNFDPAQVYGWLTDLIASGVRIVTQNGIYDWGWLRADGGIVMPPADRLEEVGALAFAIDENQFKYSLDALCERYGLRGKDETVLREAVVAAGFASGRKKIIRVQEHIHKLPARYVDAYARADAVNTLLLWEKLDPILDRERTRDAYRLDVDLLPMVLEMRRRGVRIDQDAAERARDLLLAKRDAALAELSAQLGTPVSMDEINRNRWKAQTFDVHGINYPRTLKGNPSFSAGKSGWMAKHKHWLPQLIAIASKYDAAGAQFIEGHILAHIVNGRIHAEIHPFRADDGGTRSSRFSYSNPPLQQMPSRDEELAPIIRGVFLPEDGQKWAKPDVSQQEFRFVVHYAMQHNLPGASEAAEVYLKNPDADFHALVADMTGLARSDAKAVNFAKIFGAGPKKFAEMIGRPRAEAQALYTQYDARLPFVSRLSAIVQERAVRIGFTELYDGARRHWNLYEAVGIYAKGAGPCSVEEARRRWADPEHPWHGAQLRRSGTYTALNALIQGSAARHTKLWMRACWREGIVPLLQMHDCLDCSVSSREQGELVARLGCEAVQLAVPIRVDLKFGRNWADAQHDWDVCIDGTAPPKPAAPKPTKPVLVAVVPKPALVAVVPKPVITILPKPAIAIPPMPPIAAPAPAPLPPVVNSHEEMQIDLADLISDELVPDSRKIRCRFHDEVTPSLHIYPDHYYCFGCGACGDHVKWLMQVEGLDYGEALHVLENWDGPVVPQSAACSDDDFEGTEKRRVRALQLWDAAKPIHNTLAARYLADTRGIDLDALPATIDNALRFHPRCPFGRSTVHPCLVALMRDAVGNAATGIQRIALTAEAQKIERMMFGFAGVVKLWPAGQRLVVAEGLETTLAAATRLPYRGAPLQPAWAMLSKGALERFPVIAGVAQLIVLADHDLNGEGQAAAAVCMQRWGHAARSGVRLLPDTPGDDFNDVIKKMRERTL